ncbi:MAG: hypothetical protein MJ003_05740 [Paludibacteraceae bacterium]|nr:hypothetical protein [Paludibacteraceae bacterium]
MKNLKLISVLALGLMLALVSCNKEDKAQRKSVDDTLSLAKSALETDGKEFEKKILAQGYTKIEESDASISYLKGENEGWILTKKYGEIQIALHVKQFEGSQYNEYLNELITNADQLTKTYKDVFQGLIMTQVTMSSYTGISQFKNEVKKTQASDFIEKNFVSAAGINAFEGLVALTQILYTEKKFQLSLGVSTPNVD